MSSLLYRAWRPYVRAFPIEPSNSVNFGQGTCDAIWGAVGDVVVAAMHGGHVETFTIGGDGLLEIKARRVNLTGTTSAGLVALYSDTSAAHARQ